MPEIDLAPAGKAGRVLIGFTYLGWAVMMIPLLLHGAVLSQASKVPDSLHAYPYDSHGNIYYLTSSQAAICAATPTWVLIGALIAFGSFGLAALLSWRRGRRSGGGATPVD